QFAGGLRGTVSLNRAASGELDKLSAEAPVAAAMAPADMLAKADRNDGSLNGAAQEKAKEPAGPGRAESGRAGVKGPDLSQVTARKNLNETAFFFPQLLSDADGVVKLQFTMPEALTQWRFLGFAHDQQVRSGFLEGHAITAKDLMVQPNPPRFLREGDILDFTVKVSNQTAARQQGRVRLAFSDAQSQRSADGLLGNGTPEIPFDVPARQSRSYSWSIKVPDGAPFLTYKAVGSTGTVSDGEEGYLPVLSRRIFVTESLPLPIRGKTGGPVTKRFEFEKLLKSGQSRSLTHQGLTVQMVSNPSWYAVMALPYLMEYPHECTEQTFNRLYANALARFIANSDPKIRRVFDQWQATPALDSPLEKNQDLKSVLLEETPWLHQANGESQARRNVGRLFDANRLDHETERTLQQLAQMQLPDGSWPWFPGGRGNDYITLYITTGFGRLRHLGADLSLEAPLRALGRLDAWLNEHYGEILKGPHPEEYVPSATDALYLYGRSFFLKDKA
ncbi:MAG TPA: alpha-2-macroglobulin family protein, partial [Candidatus Binatia bacterium]|nr:alpha-2-macroglobulin family protein [Candidatus Binatia bacterium]